MHSFYFMPNANIPYLVWFHKGLSIRIGMNSFLTKIRQDSRGAVMAVRSVLGNFNPNFILPFHTKRIGQKCPTLFLLFRRHTHYRFRFQIFLDAEVTPFSSYSRLFKASKWRRVVWFGIIYFNLSGTDA